MKQSCCWACGLDEREPVMDAEGRGALRCPACGHLDYMEDLPHEVRFVLWREAKRSRGIRHLHPPRRNERRGIRFVPAPGGVAVIEEGSNAAAERLPALSAN